MGVFEWAWGVPWAPVNPRLIPVVALVRAAWRAVVSPPLHPAWTRRDAAVVHFFQGVLSRLGQLPPALQRTVLLAPRLGRADGLSEERLTLGGQEGLLWTVPSARTDRRVVYFHGGGYVIGRPEDARPLMGGVAAASGVPVLSVGYSLSPENPCEQAVVDAVRVVRAVIAQGVPPEGIVLAGDSAGGGLAARALVAWRDAGEPRLGGAILGSPWVDLSNPGASVRDNAPFDLLPAETLGAWSAQVTADPTDAGVSPRYADLAGLPPLFVAVGELELFRDDILAFVEAARAAGVSVDVWLGEAAVHVWYSDPMGLLPGPAGGIERVADFLRRVTR